MITPEHVRKVSATRTGLVQKERELRGQFWQGDGSGWVGAVPVQGYSSHHEALLALRKHFSPLGLLEDITAFHLDAIEGDWNVSLTRPLAQDESPTDAEQALIDRAEALLTTFWDDTDAGATIIGGLEPLLWANLRKTGEKPLTVAYQRLLITESEVRAATPEDATPYLRLEAPSPLAAGALRDDAGKVVAYYYSYSINNQDYTEITGLGKDLYPDERGYAEHTFVTIWRQGEVVGRAAYDLGGWLLHNELTAHRLLISESLLSEQRGLNTANTLKQINLQDQGFSSRDVFNVDIPGVWVVGGDRVGLTGGTVISEKEAETTPGAWFRADKIERGPNITNVWEASPIYDAQGNITGRAPASVVNNEPASSQEFRDSIDHSIQLMYRLGKQSHRLDTGGSGVSAESRVVAERGFSNSLEPTRRAYEAAVVWSLSTVLRLAATLSGAPALFDSLRVVCAAKKTIVQPTSDNLRVLTEARAAGNLSLERYLEITGFSDDVDADLTRIKAERLIQEGTKEKLELLFELLERGVLTADDVRNEAIKLGLVEKPTGVQNGSES